MANQRLRDYQVQAVDAVMGAIGDGCTRVLFVSACGTGKTTVLAAIAERLLEDPFCRILFLAHRKEIIEQAERRIREFCGLDEWEIGTEMAAQRACGRESVIVGSIQSVAQGTRLDNWTPTVIIADESHRSASESWVKVQKKYGVHEGRCIIIGCTATPLRTDKTCLYAVGADGARAKVKNSKGEIVLVQDHEAVYEKLVYEYNVLEAMDDGWLVPIRGFASQTSTSLDGIPTRMGDFAPGALEERIDNNIRNDEIVSAWRDHAQDRQTLAFCQGVVHAHHVAATFRAAGIRAEALSGETGAYDRARALANFQSGELKVICNDALYTEGVDLPACGCVLMARPTKSWTRYMQSAGRGFRPVTGLLDALQDRPPAERRAAIAASAKPDAIIIDMADVFKTCGSPCAVPSIIHLPANLNLEGHALTEVKAMLDEYENAKERVIGELPTTYTALKVKLEAVNLMLTSSAKSVQRWRASDKGYSLTGVQPGYTASLLPLKDGTYSIEVRGPGGVVVLDQAPRHHAADKIPTKQYLDKAAERAVFAIAKHISEKPKIRRGTLNALTVGQRNCLVNSGYKPIDIDCMPLGYAKKRIGELVSAKRRAGEP